MNNDNDENNNNQTQDTLIKELSALTEYYLPDGILVNFCWPGCWTGWIPAAAIPI